MAGTDAHHVANVRQQATPERAARVGTGKIFGAKATRIEQGHRQRVAQCQHGGGAGGRRQIERARFLRHRGVEVHVGSMASDDCGLPVMLISLAPCRLMIGTMVSNSALSPELESAISTSSRVIIPRSPWLASAG
jgi:hypothetical protein